MTFGDPNRPKCTGRSKVKDADDEYVRDEDGKIQTRPCRNDPVAGTKVCRMHGGAAKQTKNKAAVVAEVQRWGLGDSKIDPGETLLRLVSQSAARADHYARLLAEAYDAADRLKAAHEAKKLVGLGELADDEDTTVAARQASADLERIFNLGGVAALVGNTYSASNTGSVYATGEAIRGLTKLEAEERDRCATMATKAIAAGLAERQVRLAERQAEVLAELIDAALQGAGVTGTALVAGRKAAAQQLRLLQGGA